MIQGVLPARERIDQSESVIGRYSVISQKVLLSHSVTRYSFNGRYSVTRIVTRQRVLLAETVLLVTVLLADTLLPGVIPVIDFHWQIHCYKSEVFFLANTVLQGVLPARKCIDIYDNTRSVTSQRLLLADTVLPDV